MNNLVIKLIRERMAKNNLSMRAAALKIGVSHTTMQRTLSGEPYDVPTAEKFAKWLNVPISTLLDLSGEGVDALAMQIAALLRQEPRLVEVFAEAVSRVLNGTMSPETFRALASYAAFQFKLKDESEVAGSEADRQSETGSQAAEATD